MKSLGVVALGLVCVALFVFAVKNVLSTAQHWESWELDTTRLFTALEVERIVRDSLAAQTARDSVEVGRLLGVAERNRTLLVALRDTIGFLDSALSHSQTPSDSLAIALQTAQTYRDALGVASSEIVALRGVYEAQSIVLTRLKLSEQQAWALVDSAASVIRRVPKPCRVPLLGLPCPVPTVGVGLTADGIRAYVGIGFPLRQH